MESITLNELRTIIREAAEASLDEGIMNTLNQHQSQRTADSINGDANWRVRNGITAKDTGAAIAGGALRKYSDPMKLADKAANMALNAKAGADKARYEREQKKARDEAYRELQKLNAVQQRIDQKAMQEAGATFVGDHVTGSNVDVFSNGKGNSFRIAMDTRSKNQKMLDGAIGVGQSAAAGLIQTGIDKGLDKISNLAGYGAAKARYAIQDAKMARQLKKAAKDTQEQIKLRAKQDQEMKRLQVSQQNKPV